MIWVNVGFLVLVVTSSCADGFMVSTVRQNNMGTNRQRLVPRMMTIQPPNDANREDSNSNVEFWRQQRELITSISERNIAREQREQFAKTRQALVSDTAYFSSLIFCLLWGILDNPFVAISYSLGAFLGTAYAFGLGKYVESIGGSAQESGSIQNAGLGQARLVFLVILFVIVGQFRNAGIQPIPSIIGFFTYQITSLFQGINPTKQ